VRPEPHRAAPELDAYLVDVVQGHQVAPVDADEARRRPLLLEAAQEALAQGQGAINVDGVMVDAASIRIVQNLIDRADLIGM
jgi:citrate lyase subunit beta/citryl-CoA lyase